MGANPSAEQEEILDILFEAYNRAIKALGPGIKGKDVDLAARNYLAEHDLSQYMLYGGAHSIGLREFEQPFFGPNSDYVIVPNMVVAVDVHIYGHPQFPGARYEEVFAITGDGKRSLNQCPRFAKNAAQGKGDEL